MTRIRCNRAFTLTEIMIVVVILGLLALVITANSSKGKYASELSVMKSRASALNLAQASYVEAVGTNTALTTWAAQTTQDQYYQLVKSYLQFPPANLTTYVYSGWTITFASDPRSPVVLQFGSTTIAYQ